MKTLLDDSFYHRYSDLAEVIRHVSDHPKKDLEQQYRQMVFNVFIGNRDDHEKNFSMLHGDNGWQLTPAYDLLPNTNNNPEHGLSFTSTAYAPTVEEMIQMGKGPFGLSKQRSDRIIQEVLQPFSNWRQILEQHLVHQKDIEHFVHDVKKRIK